jgi:hypothetical protein
MITHNSTRILRCSRFKVCPGAETKKKSTNERIGVRKSGNEISFKPKIQYTQKLILSHKTKGITLAFNSTAKSSVFLLRNTLFKRVVQLPKLRFSLSQLQKVFFI